MLRPSMLLAAATLAACGGGGGAVANVPVAAAARLSATNVEIGPTMASAELLVQLATSPAKAASLLQVAIELPAGLTLPAHDRLLAVAPLATLDGDFVGNRFVVVCGDAHNVDAQPLAVGPLFRLRVQPTSPRQPGTWTVRFFDLRAASREGIEVPAETSPTVVDVVVH